VRRIGGNWQVGCHQEGILHQLPGAEVTEWEQHSEAQHVSTHMDCFVVSGSKALEGVGSYVVVAVDTKSFNGRIMMGASFYFYL